MRRTWHLTAVSERQLNAFPTPAVRTAAVRSLIGHHGDRSLWFCVSDTHYHALIEAEEADLPMLLRDVRRVLNRVAKAPFERPRAKPVANRAHLESCFKYILANREHMAWLAIRSPTPGPASPTSSERG
jgi:hypothetical protein